MRRQTIHAIMGIMGIGLLALGVCAAAVPALAQTSHYSSARKADDNGSVAEPGPAAGSSAAVRQPVRGRRLVNQAPTPQQQHQSYSSARKADDNGSVAEPGPSR
jgi:hypothetical protein